MGYRQLINTYKTWPDYSKDCRRERLLSETDEEILLLHNELAQKLNCGGETERIIAHGLEWGYPDRTKFIYYYDWIFPLRLAPFETSQFYIPHISEAVLADNFGNYDRFPDYFRMHHTASLNDPESIAAIYNFCEMYSDEKSRNDLCKKVIDKLALQ